MRIYQENGIEYRKEECPEGWVEVNTYRPHSTPWDCYGNQHILNIRKLLSEAGIDSVGLVTHERRTSPIGTGPGGRVRFGDDMMPGVYRVAVKQEKEFAARQAIAEKYDTY